MTATTEPPTISPVQMLGAIETARLAIAPKITHTPLLSARWLSREVGGSMTLKAESLQRTGSFKVRGATVKLSRLNERQLTRGVVAASAGNHGQAMAYAAGIDGVPCWVLMPEDASVAKVEAVEAYGGTVELGGSSVDDCVERARSWAEDEGAEFVHPFDDPAILAGNGTLAPELLEAEPDLGTLVVPVGGGGLSGAVALALKESGASTRIVGVQVEGCAPLATGEQPPAGTQVTLADGIAIKQPGRLTRPLIERYVDDMCVVSEDAIAEAIAMLMQRSKLVVEGAGAAGVAALLAGKVAPARRGRTVAILTGGNIAIGALTTIVQRHEFSAGRYLNLLTKVPDRPGGLAELLTVIASVGANVVAAEHLRDGVDLHVGETAVELVLQTRGRKHSDEVNAALLSKGYPVEA